MYSEFNAVWDNARVLSPEQSKREAFFLWALVKQFKPKNILEIGNAKGGSAYIWEQAVPEARMILIDIPTAKLEKPLRPGKDCVLVDSQSPSTLAEVKKIFNGENLDFLFIDGHHGALQVRQDYDWYGALVNRGIIVFHDTMSCTGVNSLWAEISKGHSHALYTPLSTIEIIFPRKETIDTPQILGTGIVLKNIEDFWLYPVGGAE